jgi:hypothetical protein
LDQAHEGTDTFVLAALDEPLGPELAGGTEFTGPAAPVVQGGLDPAGSTSQTERLGEAAGLDAAVEGDLFESLIKRDVGVKDTGRAFGAHGGALDRVDGVLFAVVAGYYVWHAMLAA